MSGAHAARRMALARLSRRASAVGFAGRGGRRAASARVGLRARLVHVVRVPLVEEVRAGECEDECEREGEGHERFLSVGGYAASLWYEYVFAANSCTIEQTCWSCQGGGGRR